jgi:GAF domain-containing protein
LATEPAAQSKPAKLNCWEALGCPHHPGSAEPCPVATDATSDGVNGGVNAGRICWTVPGTRCFGRRQAGFAHKLHGCLDCRFFLSVKAEEGEDFRSLKLAQGLRDTSQLHATIARTESFDRLQRQLHDSRDLQRLTEQIALEAQHALSAEGAAVLLVEQGQPVLRGPLFQHGEATSLSLPLDETTPVGSVVLRNEAANLVFSPRTGPLTVGRSSLDAALDCACGSPVRSLLAVPMPSSAGQPVGVVVAVNSAHGAFSADDHWFAERYAVVAALAVEKARLLEGNLLAGREASAAETLRGLAHSLKGATQSLRCVGHVVRQALADGRPADIEAACEVLDRQVQKVVNLSKAVGVCDVDPSDGPLLRRLDEVVADVLSAFEPEAEARAISLDSRVDEACGRRTCDAVLVHRCLVNLLSRAFCSCPPSGGSVALAVGSNGEPRVVVEVSCSEPVLESEAPADGGSAYGHDRDLSALMTLLRAHNGHLETHSHPGTGTTCRLSLPLPAAGE